MDLFQIIGKIAIQNSEANNNIDKTSDKAKGASEEVKKFGDEGEKSESKLKKAFEKIGSAAVKVGKAVGVGLIAGSAAMAKLGKEAITAYSDYEQLVGGVETLFGTGGLSIEEYAKKVGKSVNSVKSEYAKLEASQATVIANADKAYKTAGMSANDYMETVTSFSASLLQGLNGDTVKAASIADKAIIAMSDNANKMGTDISLIQNTYQGFAKQNYTMLDNLKLGYGGTASEMARLINDSGVLGKSMKVTADNVNNVSFDKIIEAIGVVQDKMGITGTTAKEAASTIQGSVGMMKASWTNLLVGLADDTQDFDALLGNFVDSVITVFNNILPRIQIVVQKIPTLIEGVVNQLPSIIQGILPSLIQGAITLVQGLVAALPAIVNVLLECVPTLIDGVMQIADALIGALPQIIKLFLSAIPSLLPQIIDAIVNLIMMLVEMLPQIIQPIIQSLPEIITALIDALLGNLPALIQGVIQLVLGIVNAVDQIITTLVPMIPTIILQIDAAIIKELPTILSGILQLLSGIVQCVYDWYTSWISGFGQALSLIIGKIAKFFVNIGTSIKTKLSELLIPIKEHLNKAWEAVKNVFETIKNVIQTAFMFIGSIIKAAFDIITLPFRFIWENCKEYIFAAWEWIKEKVSSAINAVKSIIEKVMTAIYNFIKSILDAIKGFFEKVWNGIVNFITPILNKIKTTILNVFNAIKTTISNILNGIKTIVSNIFNGIKTTISTVLNSIKSAVSTAFNAVKTAIEKPINAAKDIVKKGLNAIKGFFDKLKLKFPKIKLPHFKVEGKLSISPPSVPKLTIDWYKKAMDNPMILNEPTIFGYNPSTGSFMGAGEAGSEVVSGTNSLLNMIQYVISDEIGAMSYYLKQVITILADYFPQLLEVASHDIFIDGRRVAKVTAGYMDEELGRLSSKKNRGR